MLDFTSALYLGLRHPTESLEPWAQFTTGRPAALATPPAARKLGHKLAALQGLEAATLGPSTLHLFWDLFGMLAAGPLAIYVDEAAYPIARWGAERAAAAGAPLHFFPHHDADALQALLAAQAPSRRRPVVVADGMCPGCGAVAPVAAYLECARRYGGLLVLDDTQALGVLGHSPDASAPYGRDGGGVLRWSAANGPDVIVISSLAKAFGAPVAVLAATEVQVRQFEARSATRVSCSPPSVAALRAAERALAVNRTMGDALRLRLARLVARWRRSMVRARLGVGGGLFPAQTIALGTRSQALRLHERLLELGVRTVVHRARCKRGPQISLLITARHRPEDLDHAVDALVQAVRVEAGTGSHRSLPKGVRNSPSSIR